MRRGHLDHPKNLHWSRSRWLRRRGVAGSGKNFPTVIKLKSGHRGAEGRVARGCYNNEPTWWASPDGASSGAGGRSRTWCRCRAYVRARSRWLPRVGEGWYCTSGRCRRRAHFAAPEENLGWTHERPARRATRTIVIDQIDSRDAHDGDAALPPSPRTKIHRIHTLGRGGGCRRGRSREGGHFLTPLAHPYFLARKNHSLVAIS